MTVDNIIQKEHDIITKMRDELIPARVINLLRSKLHLTLDTDAFDKQIECVFI